MNLDKMQKIAAYLERTSAEDRAKIADDMAKNAPHLFVGNVDMSDRERAKTLIKMQINILATTDFHYNSITTFEQLFGFAQGLIMGCSMSGLITQQEEVDFQKKAADKRTEFYKCSE